MFGNIALLNEESISIVGTRNITDYGTRHGKKMCRQFAVRDIPIVSGLAVGTDTLAHKTALKYDSKTIAVLPSGLNKIYPEENTKLIDEIIKKQGLIVTEYEENVEKTSSNCLKRNRIVSALGECLLVIEAGFRSGTSVTARIAKNQGKCVFAVPRKFG